MLFNTVKCWVLMNLHIFGGTAMVETASISLHELHLYNREDGRDLDAIKST